MMLSSLQDDRRDQDEGGDRGDDPASRRPDDPGPTMSSHWAWRPEWTSEHRVWWWYGTFEHDAAVQRLAEETRGVLRPGAPFDVVPPRWLHLSLVEVGHGATFPRWLASQVGRTAARQLRRLDPVEVTVGPVRTMSGAVVLQVRGQRLRDLYHHLESSLPGAPYERPVQRPFDPHVSVAYAAGSCRAHEALDVGQDTELLGRTVTTTLDHVTLAEVVRDPPHYRWTPRCRIALRGD